MPSEAMPYFVTLSNRGLVHLEGEGRHGFLQNLITNDIALLTPENSLYSCLLSPQGKFLHDFFIVDGNGFTLLDCEGGARALDLFRTLNRYRLRAKVTISFEEKNSVYALPGAGTDGLRDPRRPEMGRRAFERPSGLEEKPFETWDRLRIGLGIPDGSRDMIPGQDTLLECNIDRFNGVSFDKGCYVGQEITSRMHHRGLVKKRLYPVRISENALREGANIHINGRMAGQVRSRCGDTGLAMLREDSLADLDGNAPIRLLTGASLSTPSARGG